MTKVLFGENALALNSELVSFGIKRKLQPILSAAMSRAFITLNITGLSNQASATVVDNNDVTHSILLPAQNITSVDSIPHFKPPLEGDHTNLDLSCRELLFQVTKNKVLKNDQLQISTISASPTISLIPCGPLFNATISASLSED